MEMTCTIGLSSDDIKPEENKEKNYDVKNDYFEVHLLWDVPFLFGK